MIFLLGIPALIGGISAALATTGTAVATTSVAGALGSLGAAAGLGLAAKGAAAATAKAIAAKIAAGAGSCVAASLVKEAGESVAKNVFCDKVRPVRGSVLKVDLVCGQVSHTGVYLGDNRIAEVADVNGQAVVQTVSPREFLSGSGLVRTGAYIYVATAMDENGCRPVASEETARRAEQMVGGRGKYRLLSNNCHEFTCRCVTGRDDGSWTLSASGVASELRDKFGVGRISWRSTGFGIGDATFG